MLLPAGLIQPVLQENGQVCVDMGEPILDGPAVPTTLPPTQDGNAVVRAPLQVAGRTWAVTCVSMGNPHAVVYVDEEVTGTLMHRIIYCPEMLA